MAQKVCELCLDSERCTNCQKQIIFYNIGDFVDWMLAIENHHYIFIAHNAKGYDSHMIINELQKRKIPRDSKIDVTVNGTKILLLAFRKIEIKDLSLFIPMKLESFPKAFGIKELKKGFFPHSFNKPENFTYIDPYPAKSFYGYDYFSVEKQAEFDQFYESVRDKEFF